MRTFIASRTGATAIEYGLLLALISILIVTALPILAAGLEAAFNALSAEFTGNASGTP